MNCLFQATEATADHSQAALVRVAECLVYHNIDPDSPLVLQFFYFLPTSQCFNMDELNEDGSNYADAISSEFQSIMQVGARNTPQLSR